VTKALFSMVALIKRVIFMIFVINQKEMMIPSVPS